ncbi:hypothetical protein GCM10012275_57080 [Longimycelium tulufanense]|uniref:Excalibur calcium-binding domain-containing protein n=2 Tax=Longimycelium tulufanense TaxID=907463 RepID=A0A8J3FY43_9PSEU|nr:hypothetical protein GCM10012275_57080 [Longimycelium tulufanense]
MLIAGCGNGSAPAGPNVESTTTTTVAPGTTTGTTTTTTTITKPESPPPAPPPPPPPAPPTPEAEQRKPAPTAAERALDPRFRTCKEAKANGYGPYYKGVNPEYDWYFDRDHDGKVCE